jgi:hypothetical protein
METFLRCFVHACPKKWFSWLPLVVFWYNSCFHAAIGRSPFKALYGQAPRVFGIAAIDSAPLVDLDQWLQDRRVMTDLIGQHLNKVVLRMKNQADKGRSE